MMVVIHTKTTMSKTPPSSSSASVLSSLHVVLVPSTNASTLASTERTSAQFSTHQATHPLPHMLVTHTLNESAGHHFNNCIVNIQNYFGPQSTNQASSSRVACQIGELARSPSIPRRKRRRAYIIGRFYTRGRIMRLHELGQTFVIRLVIRL